jgi:N-acyl-D-amino-acid deacylase
MYEIIIKNGTVIDGSGKAAKRLDLGIQNGKITAIAPKIEPAEAALIIDAKNRFVTPGFIDIQNHSDSYWTLFDQPDQASLLAQGITSIVIGNCGSSLAPLSSKESIKTIQKWHDLSGININWASFEEFLKVLSSRKIGVNVGSLIGHATIRRGLLGDAIRKSTDEEVRVMDRLAKEALKQGALGLSLGLIYAHEVNSTEKELESLVDNLKKDNKYLSVHLRSEASHVLEGIDEAIHLASKFKVPLKISHLKIRGKENWHLSDQVINRLESAFHAGLDISFDVYPYSTTWSVLYTYLPKWAYEGGHVQLVEMLKSGVSKRKILDYLRHQEQDYASIIVAEASGSNSFVGKTIRQIAQNQNVSNEEAVLNLVSASSQAIVFDHNLSDENVELFCSSPLSMIATDGPGYSGKIPNLPHPRCFGTMPRFLKLSQEKKLMTWEQAIKKITSEPARLMGLKNRGVIAKKAAADLVILDPLVISDRSDYLHPDVPPIGIDTVMVNGQVAFDKAKVGTLNGQVLSR